MSVNKKKHSSMSEFKSLGPGDQSLISRLIKDNERPRVALGSADVSALIPAFRANIRNATDATNLMKVLPFLKLAKDILVSSIISPGDLVKHELQQSSGLVGVDTRLMLQLDRVIKRHFFTEKNVPAQVSNWIEEALVTSGSHPILIIPQASLDKQMGRGKYSTEDRRQLADEFNNKTFYPSKGILQNPSYSKQYLSMESDISGLSCEEEVLHTIQVPSPDGKLDRNRSNSLPISVTDNFGVAARPLLRDFYMEQKLRTAYGVPAFEAATKSAARESSNDIYREYFKTVNSKYKRLMVMPSSTSEENRDLDHPLEYHLPPECVVPVFNPGEPESPNGYFVAFDRNGYPASYLTQVDYYDDIRHGYIENNSGAQQAGGILSLANEVKSGSIKSFNNQELDRLHALHTDIMERDLVARLGSLKAGDSVELGMTTDFSKMMYARSMKNQHTTLLYVPAEFMIYFAFECTPFGVGKSILEDAKEHAALLAALKVAQVMQALKNAIPGKDINIKLDPRDANPQESVIEQINEAISLQYHHIPVNISSTADVSAQLQNSAWNINIEGNERYPDMRTSIQDRERPGEAVNLELQDGMKEELYNAMGLTSEMINNVNQPEFAVTAVQQSILLRKRVVMAQSKATPHLSNYVRVYTINSGVLCKELLEVIEANAKSLPKGYESSVEFLEDYINNIIIKLPEPIIDDMDHKSDLIDKFSNSLDKVLPAYIEQNFFTDYDPEKFKTEIEQITAAYKGQVMRTWLRKHSIMSELEIFSVNEDGDISFDVLNEMISHNDHLNQAIGTYITRAAERQKKNRKETSKVLKTDKEAVERVSDIENPPEESEGIAATSGNSQTGELEETSDDPDMTIDDSIAQDGAGDDTELDDPEGGPEDEVEEADDDDTPPTV